MSHVVIVDTDVKVVAEFMQERIEVRHAKTLTKVHVPKCLLWRPSLPSGRARR
jgi:hypothetical protein